MPVFIIFNKKRKCVFFTMSLHRMSVRFLKDSGLEMSFLHN